MSSKAELIDQLETRDSEVAKLQAQLRELTDKINNRDRVLEETIKKRYPPRGSDLRKVVTLQTKDDLLEVVDFLEKFDLHMPIALVRIFHGAKAHLEEWDRTEEDDIQHGE